jgi:hypothetical protein
MLTIIQINHLQDFRHPKNIFIQTFASHSGSTQQSSAKQNTESRPNLCRLYTTWPPRSEIGAATWYNFGWFQISISRRRIKELGHVDWREKGSGQSRMHGLHDAPPVTAATSNLASFASHCPSPCSAASPCLDVCRLCSCATSLSKPALMYPLLPHQGSSSPSLSPHGVDIQGRGGKNWGEIQAS